MPRATRSPSPRPAPQPDLGPLTQALEPLSHLPRLTHLIIKNCKQFACSIDPLDVLETLEYLSLSGSPLISGDINKLPQGLQVLDITFTDNEANFVEDIPRFLEERGSKCRLRSDNRYSATSPSSSPRSSRSASPHSPRDSRVELSPKELKIQKAREGWEAAKRKMIADSKAGKKRPDREETS